METILLLKGSLFYCPFLVFVGLKEQRGKGWSRPLEKGNTKLGGIRNG